MTDVPGADVTGKSAELQNRGAFPATSNQIDCPAVFAAIK
jgi:hypothetical protein